MAGQWKPIVVMTGGTNQAPALKADDLAPNGTVDFTNGNGKVLTINHSGDPFNLEWQAKWDHTTESGGHTGDSFNASVGGSYSGSTWTSNPMLAEDEDVSGGTHPDLLAIFTDPVNNTWTSGNELVATYEDTVGVFSGFSAVLDVTNSSGHAESGSLAFTKATLKLSQLSVSGLSDEDYADSGMPLDLNANLYDHKTYGASEVAYSLNWAGGPQNGSTEEDNRFKIATNIKVNMNNTSTDGHPQNVPYETFIYGEDSAGSLQMNGTTTAPYLFEAELMSDNVRHINTDDTLTLSVTDHNLHISNLKYSQSTDCSDATYMATTATNHEITACKNNNGEDVSWTDWTVTPTGFTGAWNADYFKSWDITAASSTFQVGSANTFQYGDAGDNESLTTGVKLKGDTGGTSVEMETPVVTNRTTASHWSYDHPVTGVAITSAIDGGGNVELITVSGTYGNNNRVRKIEAGDGFSFATIGPTANLDGGLIKVGLPSSLTAATADATTATSHTHELTTTWNGAENVEFGGYYERLLRSTDPSEAIASGMDSGSLQLQNLDIHHTGTFWDGTNTIVFNPESAINDNVVQLNVVYSDIDGYCSDSAAPQNVSEYACISDGGTCSNNTYNDQYDNCLQDAGTCSCADGSNECTATGSETYVECAAIDPSTWNGYGDGVGGSNTSAEWVTDNTWAADNVWIANVIDSYGEFPTSGELGGGGTLAVGLVLGNLTAEEGGAVTIGEGSSAAGTYYGSGNEGTFDYPIMFRNPDNLAYKGLEIGENTWTSSTGERELGFDMTDGSTGIAAHGDSDYNRNALMGIGTGGSWIDGGDEHASGGVLTVIKSYSSLDNTGSQGPNAGNMIVNPSDQVGNTSYYDGVAVPGQSIVGTGYNLALGIGEHSVALSGGSNIIAESGGSLSCDYILLGDIGTITTNGDAAYNIDSLTDATQNGMLVAKHGADADGGGLYLLHNVV